MAGFAPRNDDSRPGPRFRIVEDEPEVQAESGEVESDGIASTISKRLLVDPPAWQERGRIASDGALTLRVEVPLVASLARIRSEADAALALTGVLELVARRFQVRLPCAWTGDASFCCDAPAGTAGDDLAQAVNEELLALVRATDLQGALRDQYLARVTEIDAAEVA